MLDPTVPESLYAVQSWFGAIIRQKMGPQHTIAPHAPNGCSIVEEAVRYIVDTPKLAAWKRMELYTQSYWLRLLSNLSQEFPTLVRLFGEDNFNSELGMEYLEAYPPNHWSLNLLGKRFVSWIEESYNAPDRALILNLAKLDWAYQELFLIKRGERVEITDDILSRRLQLQPTVRLFEFSANFLQFRKELLAQDAAYWQEHDFPKLSKEGPYYFALYRKATLVVDWEELSREEYLLLSSIAKGKSIDETLDAMDEHFEVIEASIAFWAQKWRIFDWITNLSFISVSHAS